MKENWNITLLVSRKKGQEAPHFDKFLMEVSPDEYVLDAVERVWAFHDRSLCFAHACHHSTCGACGMRVNGTEKLTCITSIRSVTHDGGTLRVEPLRNFPVVSDLVVDMGGLYRKMEMVGHHSVVSVADEPAEEKLSKKSREEKREFMRLADCIECGLCVSACPAAATNEDYIGPAPLAGSLIGDWNSSGYSQYLHDKNHDGAVYKLIDGEIGLWRCHSAFECTSVCPSNVNPAGRIMELRRQVLGTRLKNLFR